MNLFRQDTRAERHGNHTGFTMIELLVAMSVLVILVLIVSMVFQRAATVWDAGMNKAELDMTGRAVADYVAQELAAAVPINFVSALDFSVLGEASGANRAICAVKYEFASGILKRNGTEMVQGLTDFVLTPTPSAGWVGLPQYVDVTVTVTNSAGAKSLYQSRAYFLNRNRYKL